MVKEKLSPRGLDDTLLQSPLLSVRYLSGAVKGSERTALLRSLKEGTTGIVVGTHALLTDHAIEAFHHLVIR
jgi:RecG-like helicase